MDKQRETNDNAETKRHLYYSGHCRYAWRRQIRIKGSFKIQMPCAKEKSLLTGIFKICIFHKLPIKLWGLERSSVTLLGKGTASQFRSWLWLYGLGWFKVFGYRAPVISQTKSLPSESSLHSVGLHCNCAQWMTTSSHSCECRRIQVLYLHFCIQRWDWQRGHMRHSIYCSKTPWRNAV